MFLKVIACEVAAREFGEHGFEGASLNHILAEAGVSKGAAYYYFEGKADLFAAAARPSSIVVSFDVSAARAKSSGATA